jgi:hypothetical protein
MADDYVDIYRQLADGFDSAAKPIMSDAVPAETFVIGKSAVGHLRPNVISPVKSRRDKNLPRRETTR